MALAIYTPLEPHMNAAHYITKITLNITRKYLKQGAKIIQEISKEKKSWEDLFEPTKFFEEYRSFLQISVMAKDQDDFISWKGNVESKLRKLIWFIESQGYLDRGIEVNPYPKCFEAKHGNYKFCSKYYIGFSARIDSPVSDTSQIDLNPPIRNFLELLQTYPNISKAPQFINIGCAYVSRQNISEFIKNQSKFYEVHKKVEQPKE